MSEAVVETPIPPPDNTGKMDPPDYAYSYKFDEQEELMKEAGIVGTYREMFVALCRFSTLENRKNAVVSIKNFCNHLHEKGAIPGLVVRENIQTHTYRLIANLSDKDVDLVYVKETEDDGKPKVIILKKKGEVLSSEIYTRAVRLLKNANRAVLDDHQTFYDTANLARELRVETSYLEQNLIKELASENLTEETLYEWARREVILRIKIDETVHILITPEDVKGLVHVLIEKVRNYYEDPANDVLRNAIFRGFKEKNLDVKRIPEILHGENISDKYFLLFAQLFIQIVRNYHEQQRDKNQVTRFSLLNQYIAARLLSFLAMAMRKKDNDKKLSDEKKQTDLALIVKTMVESGAPGLQGQKEYYPFSINQIASFKSWREDEEGNRQPAALSEIYTPETMREMMQMINSASPHDIANIISFTAGGETWHVHRWRIVRAFFAARDAECDRIVNRIRNEWIKFPEKIIRPGGEDKLWTQIEDSWTSDFFIAFLQAVKRVLAVDAAPDEWVKTVCSRLFPNAGEAASMKIDEDSLTRDGHGKPLVPQKILKLLTETVFFEGTFEQRRLHDILGIQYDDIYEYVWERVGTGFFRSIFHVFRNFLKFFTLKKLTGTLEDAGSGFSASDAAKKLFSSAKGIGQKVASVSQQMLEPLPGMEKNPEASRAEVKSAAKIAPASAAPISAQAATKNVKKNAKREELSKLRKIAPLCANTSDLITKIEFEHKKWNNKIGDMGKNLRDDVDALVEKIAERFAADMFAETNADRMASDIVDNNPTLKKISNQPALKRYIYMRALLTRVEADTKAAL